MLIPFVMLLWTIPDLQNAQDEITKTLLHGKMLEVEHIVDTVAAAVEASPTRPWNYHITNVHDSITHVDGLPFVYAAGYLETVNGLIRITERDNATNFDPFAYPEFIEAIEQHSDFGRIVLGFTPDNGPYRDMRLYFRWMPQYSGEGNRYLVVTAVSEYSITIKVADWVLSTPLRNTISTGFVSILNIIMSLRMGSIWRKRKGKKHRSEVGGSDV